MVTMFAVLATALTVACGWPQLRRLRRTGDVRGVSLAATTLSVASECGWVIYLSGEALWSALPESMLSMLVSAVASIALIRAGAGRAVAVVAASAWLVALVGARTLGGPPALAVLVSIACAVQLVPSVWTAWRVWCPSGVAWGAWTVRLAQSALWCGYGCLRHDPPLTLLGVIGSVASVAVLVRLGVTRARVAAMPMRRVTTHVGEPRYRPT